MLPEQVIIGSIPSRIGLVSLVARTLPSAAGSVGGQAIRVAASGGADGQGGAAADIGAMEADAAIAAVDPALLKLEADGVVAVQHPGRAVQARGHGGEGCWGDRGEGKGDQG